MQLSLGPAAMAFVGAAVCAAWVLVAGQLGRQYAWRVAALKALHGDGGGEALQGGHAA